MSRRKLNKKAYQSTSQIDQMLSNAIEQAKARLKTAKSKLTIVQRGNRLYLRGTLPCKPTDDSPELSKRYDKPIADANLEGIAIAEAKALEITQAVKLGTFTEEVMGVEEKKQPPRNMKQIKADFEEAYWRDHPQTRKSLNTWKTRYRRFLKRIPDDDYFTEKNVEKWIAETPPNSYTRYDLNRVVQTLAKFEDIRVKSYPSKFTPKPRELPTDEEIKLAFLAMPDDVGWYFGMLATYGLRPQELFIGVEKYLDSYTSSNNTRNVFITDDDTKTKARRVYPLYPEWVELFDLRNPKTLSSRAQQYESKVNKFRQLVKKHGFKRELYTLRHRYAIRGHEMGFPVAQMARWMGHSVQKHVDTYQKYMDVDTHNKIFDEITNGKQQEAELDQLQLDNQCLQKRVRELETELKRTTRLVRTFTKIFTTLLS